MRNFPKKIKKMLAPLMSAVVAAAALLGIYNIMIPDTLSCHTGETLPTFLGAQAEITDGRTESVGVGYDTYTAQYRLLDKIPVKTVSVSVWQKTYLYPGGMPFGVRFFTDGLLVVGFAENKGSDNPAKTAGIRLRDVITKINGKEITDADDLSKSVANGSPAELTCRRGEREFNVTVRPYFDGAEGRYKTGVMIRDSGAGIGTVTYVVPTTGGFGGLGHGICDNDTGALIPLGRGTVSDVTINGIARGSSGAPGEIRGCFKSGKTGSIISNTDCGVFGVFSDKPSRKALPIGLRGELTEGEATILCTLDSGGIESYTVSISDINTQSKTNKCFSIHVTDRNLIAKTGGIIQGMSGSPIIQNGKIVGAVTHVLINDPTCGYGIFIENMLSNMPDVLK